ncbi:hypothetical protein JOQ06_012680 [Pogonophryne albipinna]|uniref:Ig-like domain-containing protein n=1 Tax=Pogonophryne albipinna TaxID=1090488 RepID=A0AAD6FSD2_9TELE|nr:hypothetical protein JOQ06_012680 [Pogonophryne albipinna]
MLITLNTSPPDAPKPPSVSVSPSAEIEEGSSVTLTCSSDANPAANYAWYKEDEDSPKASGQIFTITDFRAEHSGSYSCGAQNKLGRSISTLTLSVGTVDELGDSAVLSPPVTRAILAHLEALEGQFGHYFSEADSWRRDKTWILIPFTDNAADGTRLTVTEEDQLIELSTDRSWKLLPAAVTIFVVLLAVISLSVFLWIRRKRASRDSSEPEERADIREECVPDQPEQQEDLQYASVHFSNNRADLLYSNMRAAQPLRHTEQQEVPEYAAIKFSSAAPRTRGQDPQEDPAALYSTVNKSR